MICFYHGLFCYIPPHSYQYMPGLFVHFYWYNDVLKEKPSKATRVLPRRWCSSSKTLGPPSQRCASAVPSHRNWQPMMYPNILPLRGTWPCNLPQRLCKWRPHRGTRSATVRHISASSTALPSAVGHPIPTCFPSNQAGPQRKYHWEGSPGELKASIRSRPRSASGSTNTSW